MSLGMPDGVDSREDASLLNRNVVGYGCVFYGWRNSKAMAEGRKCSGYLCYEAVGAAACLAKCPPHTLSIS